MNAGQSSFYTQPVPRLSRVALLVTLLPALLLSGCGSIPLDDAAPADFNLSGHWELLQSESGGSSARGAGIRSSFMGQDFPLLVATEMRIEQDARSMGIEYARGSYRDVSWGERSRGVWDVRAGWHDGDLHIYSEAPDISAGEVWQLSDGGQRLEINIDVRGSRDQKFRRVFRRLARL